MCVWGAVALLSYVLTLPSVVCQATFMVPRDAHVLDVVLSDVEGGEGTYDNRGGLDYHIPIEGGVGAKPHPLHVVHIAVEMAPIAKVREGGCVRPFWGYSCCQAAGWTRRKPVTFWLCVVRRRGTARTFTTLQPLPGLLFEGRWPG
jgi:hypothetical protein